MARTLGWTGALLLLALAAPRPAEADITPVHATLKSSRAQANREEIFRHLQSGGRYVPSFLAGKSTSQVQAWSRRVRGAINRNAKKIVQDIVANPSATPAKREQMILGLVSPTDRALLLKDVAGFKVDKVKYKVNGTPTTKYKIRLRRFGENEYSYGASSPEYTKQMSIYNRVMGPNLITYMPAGYHSKYVSRGKVLDLWGSSGYGDLRPNSKSLFPTWLSDGEAARMKQVFDVGNSSWSSSLGEQMAHGRPGMWPPTESQRSKTGNSCTTTFIRAPVGERVAQYAWIDKLQAKVTQAAKAGRLSVEGVDLSKAKLLEAVTGMGQEQYRAVFDQVARALPGESRDLGKLRGQVDFFYDKLKGRSYSYSYNYNSSSQEKCTFPYDLMHRTPLSTMANITGDPVGPGMATQKFRAADPLRIGVVTVFDKR